MSKIKRLIKQYIIFALAFFCLYAPQSASSDENKELPIARVYEKSIYMKDLAPNVFMESQQQTKLNDEEYLNWKNDYELKMLGNLIYLELQKQFLKKSKSEPSSKEIQAFIDFQLKSEETLLDDFNSQRDELQEKLQSADLADAQRDSATNHLNTLDNLIAQELKRREYAKSIPNYREIKNNLLQKGAVMTVTAWKYNKALFQQYGGRVIFQQAGWEPIDAYKAFLEEHRDAKTFEIFSPSYMGVFEYIYKYFDAGHNYLPQEDADKYFVKPWWDPTFEGF